MDGIYEGNAIGYNIEPVSDKGLHRYLDFYSALPQHIRERPDLMKVVFMFQDYLNDGYRLIPEPIKINKYKNKVENICGASTEIIEYSEVARPLDHTPSMHKGKILYSMTFGDEIQEEYNKERDIDTWAIDFDVIDAYKLKDTPLLGGEYRLSSDGETVLYSYYTEPKIFYSLFDYYMAYLNVKNQYTGNLLEGTFAYISQGKRDPSVSLDQSSITLDYVKDILSRFKVLPNIELTYYACDGLDFINTFKNTASNATYRIESRKLELFNGISDYFDYNTPPPFACDFSQYSEIVSSIPENYNNSFRVTIKFNVSTLSELLTSISSIDSIDSSFALKIYTDSEEIISALSTVDTYCIASSFNVILRYQHPAEFYAEFGWQNQYRHEAKKASIAEKIYRLAYSKDANVFDYEYLGVIAQHFGYSIETDESEVNQNSYYKTKDEKEIALRKVIANMPEFNRMKGTSSGIEMVLLSFGLVGRVIELFTKGDASRDGYAEFIDARLITGDIDDYIDATNSQISSGLSGQAKQDAIVAEMSTQFKNNPRLSNTSIYDWYACPHFRVEFDIGKDSINIARNTNQFSTMAKTIKKIKPINTVFQGFYAKLTEEFGELFILPPAVSNRVKQIMYYEQSCTFEDNWEMQCALELTNGN